MFKLAANKSQVGVQTHGAQVLSRFNLNSKVRKRATKKIVFCSDYFDEPVKN